MLPVLVRKQYRRAAAVALTIGWTAVLCGCGGGGGTPEPPPPPPPVALPPPPPVTPPPPATLGTGPENCIDGSAGDFACRGISLEKRVSLATMEGTAGNDVWGWTDTQTGKEYALMA